MKKRSEYVINPAEELDLKHQGSLGGEQLVGRYGRGLKEAGRTPAEGPGVAMTSTSPERRQQQTSERKPTKAPEQESSKKHHYK